MLDEQDDLIGKQGVWKEINNDSLFDSKAKRIDDDTELSNKRIRKAIQIFLDMTPLDFDDQAFLVSTDHLTGHEFAKAAFLVYLRWESNDPNAGFRIVTRKHRLYTLQRYRRLPEFQRLWAKQIEIRLKKNPLLHFLHKLWNQLAN